MGMGKAMRKGPNMGKVKVKVSRVQISVTPWTTQSTEFSRLEY